MYRSADRAKDQSYVLSTLSQEALSFARFPVGARTKSETRELARSLSLRTADKPDSYEICFVPDGDAGGFVERATGAAASPGEIVDADGEVVGEHRGMHRYTVGQRRGLGLATHDKRYVLELDPARNRVVVGPGELLARGGLEAERVSWIAAPPTPGAELIVQIRAHGAGIPARLDGLAGDAVTVRFGEPQRSIAPGQLVAFYLGDVGGDEVLGGGTITRSLR
jgi:tRNA-specific 2-thiouridylase